MNKYKNKTTGEIVEATELTKTFRIKHSFGEENIYIFMKKEEFNEQYEWVK